MNSPAGAHILVVGLEPRSMELLNRLCPEAQVTLTKTAVEFGQQFESWVDGQFAAAFCGPAIAGLEAKEIAQVLQNQCPLMPKFFLTYNQDLFTARALLKNGFSETYLLPLDTNLVRSAVETHVRGAQQKAYRSVRVYDLEPGAKLEFETYVFLPLNRKYVRFTSADKAIGPEKLAKLEDRDINSIFVDQKDMPKFYQYAASKLRSLSATGVVDASGALSETERQEKLRENVRGLFTDLFDQSTKGDFDAGREMISSCEGIISNFITKGSSSDWYKRLLNQIGEAGDAYSHSASVSTYAALFAIGIGHKRPEDLAMAGLFHDVGMVAIPEELREKRDDELNIAEAKIYYTHVEQSLNVLKNKRIIITPEVERAIVQHHERFDGKGFPKGHTGLRISEDAGLLSFADQFDYLTRFEIGRSRMTPAQAWDHIKRSGRINPDIIQKIGNLILGEIKKSATARVTGGRAAA